MSTEDTRYRVLLIDDDKLDQMAFTRFVESRSLPYDYRIVGSVSEAQRALRAQQFDAVVTDYSLGDGTALNVLSGLRDVPVIVISGTNDEEAVTGAWEAGAHDYLPKDLERNYLKALPGRIENAIQNRKMKEALDTERKTTEQKLRLVENRYRTIFENSAVAITMADDRERLVSWNRFTERLLDMSTEDLYLRPVQSLYPVEEWMRIRACNVRQKGMQHHLETRMVKKDGRLIDVDISLSVLRNSEGQAAGSIGVIRDISERKQAELKRTRLLKEVENINRELNDFASIVSHDLKAPLRGIKTLATWISTDYADQLDETGREQLRLLLSRVDWMHQLIEGVLEYSRVGRVREERISVDLNELVPKIVEMVCAPRSITIEVQSGLPAVRCERTRITQVFQNLLSNAIKYMDKPQGTIKVGCVQDDGFWRFSVADNGPGIEEKHFEKIFKIFQTLSARNKSESTGVGLTIIKKIVELYGGQIWVESKIGEGSTFFFTFPMQQESAADLQSESLPVCCRQHVC
jgi:two-component system, LuxR family, sensor kinase FixL